MYKWYHRIFVIPFFLINSYFIYLLIYLFSCVGSSFRARAFSSCGKRGPLFIAVHGPLTIEAPPVAGHCLQMRRLSSCGSWSQLLRGTWDPPRPGLEPASPALAGRFSTTAPPGKFLSYPFHLLNLIWVFLGSTVALKTALFILFPKLLFHLVRIPLRLCPFICLWTFFLLPCLGYFNIAAVHICLPLSFRFWWS